MPIDQEQETFDINALEQNLMLSPEDRAIQHQRALDILAEIERARKQIYDRPKQPSEDSAG
jgi:hypothetical protein